MCKRIHKFSNGGSQIETVFHSPSFLVSSLVSTTTDDGWSTLMSTTGDTSSSPAMSIREPFLALRFFFPFFLLPSPSSSTSAPSYTTIAEYSKYNHMYSISNIHTVNVYLRHTKIYKLFTFFFLFFFSFFEGYKRQQNVCIYTYDKIYLL